MGQPNAEQFAQRAFNLGLLDERQLQDVWASFGSRNVPVGDFVQTLLRRGFMTNYQVERLLKGERSGFFFGDYKVLYSPFDLAAGWQGDDHPLSYGYETGDALRLGANLVTYCLTH